MRGVVSSRLLAFKIRLGIAAVRKAGFVAICEFRVVLVLRGIRGRHTILSVPLALLETGIIGFGMVRHMRLPSARQSLVVRPPPGGTSVAYCVNRSQAHGPVAGSLAAGRRYQIHHTPSGPPWCRTHQ